MFAHDDIPVSTDELAAVLSEALQRGRDTNRTLERRSGAPSGSVARILRRETTATTVRVAERLLEAAGRDLTDLPSYLDEGWGERYREAATARFRERRAEVVRPGSFTHGTRYGYQQKRCRCEPCKAWCAEHNRKRPAARRRVPVRRASYVSPALAEIRATSPSWAPVLA